MCSHSVVRKSAVACAATGVLLLLTGWFASAQQFAGDERSAIHGGWTLNREASSMTPGSGDGSGEGRDRGRGAGRAPGGMGRPGGGIGGMGGGRGGFGRGRGLGGDGPVDREQMEKRRALMQDLMTPAGRWVIAGGDGGLIVFTDGDGRTARFMPNEKKEKHQLVTGTIETKTKWVGAELRQEIGLGGGIKAERTFSLDEQDRLIVSTRMDGSGRSGRRPPIRWVYDRDVVH